MDINAKGNICFLRASKCSSLHILKVESFDIFSQGFCLEVPSVFSPG